MGDLGIELRHLRYFVAVAEELHFGRAAKRLHIAQPPLSQQVRQLEEVIGHSLFSRTSRVVKLTPAGAELLERARRTLQRLDEDLEATRSVGRGEVGMLTVGFVGSAVLAGLPAALRRYQRRYPRVQLRLRELYTSGLVEAVKDGSMDVAFLRDPGEAEGIELETWFKEPFIAVLPKRHPLAGRGAISVSRLRDEPFVFFPRSAGEHAWAKVVGLCERNGFRPRVVQEAPQWLTIIRLVGAGLGVTIAPACVQGIGATDVECRELRGARAESVIEIAHRAGEKGALALAFCEMARKGS